MLHKPVCFEKRDKLINAWFPYKKYNFDDTCNYSGKNVLITIIANETSAGK